MYIKVDLNLWAKTDTDDFDVPAFFAYDLGNNLLGEVLQKEQEMNGDEISSDGNPPLLTKQKIPSKPTARENLFDWKKIRIIDETFRELPPESPTKEKNARSYECFSYFVNSNMIVKNINTYWKSSKSLGAHQLNNIRKRVREGGSERGCYEQKGLRRDGYREW